MSVRKREWTTTQGEQREAWIVDYFDAGGTRRLKTFKRKIRKTPVLLIAAAFDEGIESFKRTIREAVDEAAGRQKS